jgi:hypothetical protein
VTTSKVDKEGSPSIYNYVSAYRDRITQGCCGILISARRKSRGSGNPTTFGALDSGAVDKSSRVVDVQTHKLLRRLDGRLKSCAVAQELGLQAKDWGPCHDRS